MKQTIIITFSDNNYFNLLKELIASIKRFPQSSNISLGVLDGGLDHEQKEYLKNKIDYLKTANWDIEISKIKSRGRNYLKNHVCRAFLPNYFPDYEKYIWLDCDTWINDWKAIEYLIKGCDNGKLAAVQTIAPGYRDIGNVKWLFKSLAQVKTQNFKHAISSGFPSQIARKIARVFKSKVQYGKKDKDKRSYRVSFKKFQKLKIFNKTTNSIENTAIQINKSFKNKIKKFIDNKKFKNLDFMKYLIDQKKIDKII